MLPNDKDKDKCLSCGGDNPSAESAAPKVAGSSQESSAIKLFGKFKVKEGSWESQICMLPNDKDKDKCILYYADNPSAESAAPKLADSSQGSSASNFFGKCKVKEGSWECQACMLPNDKDKNQCISCGAENPSAESAALKLAGSSQGSSGSKSFGQFKMKEGSLECQAYMLPNDKDKDQCMSCGADNPSAELASPKLAGSSQGSSVSKSFGTFKVKEGSWESQGCMLPNDKDKVQCISCGADNPSAESAAPTLANSFQESSARKLFGTFKVKRGSWECQAFMLANDKDRDKSISCGAVNPSVESAAPKLAGSSQGSSISKSFGKFKVKEGSWECQACMLPNDKDKDQCISCYADNPSAESAAPKLANSSQESSSSNFFGKCKVKEGSWECQACMLPNDKDKNQCISCGAENPSAESAALKLARSSQGTSGSKSFGQFKMKEGSLECQAYMLPNDKDKDQCMSCGADNPSAELASPKLAGSSQGSSVSKSFGTFKVKEGSWESQGCMLPNDKDKVQCISCGADNPSAESAAPTLANSFQESSARKLFGTFKVKRGSWECQAFMLANDKDRDKSISCGAVNPSVESAAPKLAGSSRGSSARKSFGTFKVKEGSWECQACMLPNDKDKDQCISCGADNPSVESAAPKLAGSSQGSSISKSFGKFKVKEGSWECQICMLPNDKDKDKCISCGGDNPSAESAAPKVAGSSQESSAIKLFGKFKVKEGSWECQICMLPNDKDKDKCISCGGDNPSAESAAPKVAGSSQESSAIKLFGKFKVKEGSWESQICMLPNDKDKDKCILYYADNPSAESAAPKLADSSQESSAIKLFGKFKVKEGSWESQICMLPYDKDKDQCISCCADNPSAESAAPKLAGSSQGSSASKLFGKFKLKESSWECQECMLPNDKDKDKCMSCGADNPSSESSSHPVPATE